MKHPNSGPHCGPKTQAKSTSTFTPTPTPAYASRLRSEATARQASTTQNSPDSLARRGKIAGLPAEIRETLNRCLAQGVSGPKLLEWLNQHPSAQAVLQLYFHGQPISLQNLSQWRRGGFREWLLKQEAKEVLSEFAAHNRTLASLELPEKMALWLGSRLVAMAGWVDQQSPEESWPVVHQMIRDVATLRRADYQIRQQQLKEQAQRKLSHKELRDWALQPEVLASLCKEAAARQKDGVNALREASFKLIGGLSGIDPEDLVWEANKRGITVEQLVALRDAESSHWRGDSTESEVAAAVRAAAALSAAEEKAGAPDGKEKGPRLRSKASARQARTTQAAADQGKTKQIKADKGKSKCESAAAAETPPSAETPRTGLRSEASARQAKNQTPTETCASAKPAEPVHVSPGERGHSCPPNANQRDRTPDSQPRRQLDACADRNVRAPGQAGPVEHAEGTTAAVTEPAGTRPAEAACIAAAPPPEAAPAPASAAAIADQKRRERFKDWCLCGAKGQIPLAECEVCMRQVRINQGPCFCHS